MFEPRKEIEHFEPYRPGKSIDQVKRELGLKRVVKLASNENALGPSPKAQSALSRASSKMHLYPDGNSTRLREVLSRRLGVKTGEVILGAGSDELIELLGKTYLRPADDIVVSECAFIRYAMAGQLMGSRVVSVPMKDLTHDLSALAAAVTPRTKFVFVANPNNPTGTYNTASEVEDFLGRLPDSVLPVIDEAYFEFARVRKDYPDSIDYFRKGRRLITLRTFSKIYGLAGLRVGYGVAPADIVQTLDRVRPPFNVSSAAQAAAEAALDDDAHVRKTVKLVEKEKARVAKVLKSMKIEWTPSAGNFLLLDVSPRRGEEVFQALLREGVIVRPLDEYGLPRHIRVTLGLPEENDLFLKALKGVYSKP
ncbi:MAG TPA: histidinol-phosphate transaminase [Elusimicrobiota bacterium]|nr:histidinol-phosphate transaminase [Elusimicrobiota bacterium]